MTTETKKRDVALVVDDSPETLRLLTDALDGAGMTVMVAMDGAAAMRIVDQITPDIVLLDAVMPGMDGFETCRRLKREAGLSNVPVIFMTGLAETEHIVRGLEAGGVDYVTKPIVIEEMLARIRVHLANARLTQSARAALDVSGRFLLAVNRQGKIMWATPQAQRLLSDHLGTPTSDELVLPDALQLWLDQAQKGRGGPKAPAMASFPDNPQLRLHYMGKAGPNEFLLRLAKDAGAGLPAEFSSELGLTTRSCVPCSRSVGTVTRATSSSKRRRRASVRSNERAAPNTGTCQSGTVSRWRSRSSPTTFRRPSRRRTPS